MSVLDVFWIFFMLSALQPILRQRFLEAARQRLIALIERQRTSRVILLVHRQETMGLLGFPIYRFIDIQDSEEVLRAIELTDPQTPIDLVLHTPGGLVLASQQIARALKRHPGKVTVHVPHYAMSGGTLIALAADEILMSPNAVLGPVDPQLGPKPAASVLKVIERKPIAEVDDETIILADQAEKAIQQVRECVAELLTEHYPEEDAQRLAATLSEGTWTHDHPITRERAEALKLRVAGPTPPEVMRLMSLYAQPIRRAGAVEYLPEPRRPGRRAPGAPARTGRR
ncbi:MAG: hypothetical protein D6693_01940 [Planctomycetota bacterium]|nr:MAG: hypothetical protein D6693_01940 [Planctomycetota bacterium]